MHLTQIYVKVQSNSYLLVVLIMNKICTFAGHGDYSHSETTYQKIISCIKQLICEKNISEFWVGNYGSFDTLAMIVVGDLKKIYPHIKLCLVIPYITSHIIRNKAKYEKMFDKIIIPEFDKNTSIRAYIPLCNQYMVDNADTLICFIKRETGGAFKTYQHALKKNKEIINIAD